MVFFSSFVASDTHPIFSGTYVSNLCAAQKCSAIVLTLAAWDFSSASCFSFALLTLDSELRGTIARKDMIIQRYTFAHSERFLSLLKNAQMMHEESCGICCKKAGAQSWSLRQDVWHFTLTPFWRKRELGLFSVGLCSYINKWGKKSM